MASWKDLYFRYQNISNSVGRRQFIDYIEFSRNEPLEDIYEAALMLISESGDRDEWYYRGQRSTDWSIRPSLFRSRVDDIDKEIEKLSSLVRYLQSELQVSQEDALAIAKHYSGLLEDTRVRSWLLDITSNPLIACFFASHNSEADDIGQVYLFKSYEMERYGSDTPKRLGEMDVISPENVSRIERQDAEFIRGAHPDLLEKYIPINWKFKQKEGVVFTDPDLSITEDELLLAENKYEDIMKTWEEEVWPETVPTRKMVTPPHNPTEPITAGDYLEMVKQWLDEMGKPYSRLDENEKSGINDLCEVHSTIQEKENISVGIKAEMNLKQILSTVVISSKSGVGGTPFDVVVSRYWNESGEPETDRKEVKHSISEVRPNYEFKREWQNRYS